MKLRNTPFDQISIGQNTGFSFVLDEALVRQFAMMSRDCNPTHFDLRFALSQGLANTTAHRMIIPMMLSGFFGNTFPGPGTKWLEQMIRFPEPAYVGDTVNITIEVLSKNESCNEITIKMFAKTSEGRLIAESDELLSVPSEEIVFDAEEMPMLYMGDRKLLLSRLIKQALMADMPSMAVAWPMNKEALEGALETLEERLAIPVLFGPEIRIRKLAAAEGIDLGSVRIVGCETEDEACTRAAFAVGSHEMDILMKGSPHSDKFLKAILNRENHLRLPDRMLSHVFHISGIAPRSGEMAPRSIVVTDGALIPTPTLEQKMALIQNAIDFLRELGVETPKVAVLAAVEQVNPSMQATMDAAALTLMSMRGQIQGGIVDGPLAMDLAMDPAAVKAKGIRSDVAGYADILVGHILEVSNAVAKEFSQSGSTLNAGILCGAACPIVLTSRTDDRLNRLASVAIACIQLKNKRQ